MGSWSRLPLISGHSIPNIGLGVYQTPASDTARIVRHALELGYRHIDCASAYHNESQVVEAIAQFLQSNPQVKRQDIFYVSKVAPRKGYESAMNRIQESIEKARPIGYIDLYLLHSPGRDSKATLDAYRALQDTAASEQSLIKSIGVSNFGVHHLKVLFAWSGLRIPPTVNQIEINPWLQHTDIVNLCKQMGILIVVYSPLMRGLCHDDPDLAGLAAKYRKSPAQILLRWNLQKGYVVIPKTVHVDRMEENLNVFDFEMSQEDMEMLGDENEYWVTSPHWDPTVWPS